MGLTRAYAHLCTKLQVPSMGSTIQVGLGVSTHLAPAAAASSAMNLWWAGAQPEKTRQELKTQRFKLLLVPSKTKQTHPRDFMMVSLGRSEAESTRDHLLFCLLASLAGFRTHEVTPKHRSFGKASRSVRGSDREILKRILGNRFYNAKAGLCSNFSLEEKRLTTNDREEHAERWPGGRAQDSGFRSPTSSAVAGVDCFT